MGGINHDARDVARWRLLYFCSWVVSKCFAESIQQQHNNKYTVVVLKTIYTFRASRLGEWPTQIQRRHLSYDGNRNRELLTLLCKETENSLVKKKYIERERDKGIYYIAFLETYGYCCCCSTTI